MQTRGHATVVYEHDPQEREQLTEFVQVQVIGLKNKWSTTLSRDMQREVSPSSNNTSEPPVSMCKNRLKTYDFRLSTRKLNSN